MRSERSYSSLYVFLAVSHHFCLTSSSAMPALFCHQAKKIIALTSITCSPARDGRVPKRLPQRADESSGSGGSLVWQSAICIFSSKRAASNPLENSRRRGTPFHGCAQACCRVMRCTSFAVHHHDHENHRFSARARAEGTTRSADAKQTKCAKTLPLRKYPLVYQALNGCQHRDTRKSSTWCSANQQRANDEVVGFSPKPI